MPGKRVEISYEAFVRGMDRIEELIRKNKELQGQVTEYQSKMKGLEKQEEKNESVNLKLRRSILAFRKELFAVGIAVGLTAAAIKLLSLGSDALAERMEYLTLLAKKFSAPLGNFVARMFGNRGQLSTEAEVRRLGLESEIAGLQGNTRLAVIRRLEAEEKKMIKETGALWETTYKGLFEERRRLILESQRLEELGLKKMADIRRDFQRDIIGAFKGGVGDPLTKFLAGEHQTGAEILQGFRQSIAAAFSSFITESLFSRIFGAKNPTTEAVKKVESSVNKGNEIADHIRAAAEGIARCSCDTAANTGALVGRGSPSLSFEPGKDTMAGVRTAAQIAGLVSSAASFGAGLGGPTIGTGGGLPPGAGIEFGTGAFATGRYGGWAHRLPRYQSGGEIPAILHAGEFVVNSRAAAANKEALRAMNSGRPVEGGGGSVFLIKANDPASFADMLSTPSARSKMEIAIIRAVMDNGNVRRVIRDFAR